MNSRERFVSTLKFKSPDKMPLPCLFYKVHPETLRKWRQEGLPQDVHPTEYLGLERCDLMPVELGPLPQFEQVELEEMEEWRVGVNRDILAKVEAGVDMIEEKFPISGSESCEAFKELLNPNSPARYPRFWNDYVRRVQDRDYPLGLYVGSPLSWITGWIDPRKLASDIGANRSWIEGFAEYIATFTKTALKRALDYVSPDFALFREPNAYRLTHVLDKAAVTSLLERSYRPVTSWLKGAGIELIGLEALGCVGELLDAWADVGINAVSVEVSGGLDAESLRKRFDGEVALIGNIDHRALACGKRGIAGEVERKAHLFEQGGFIPAPDNTVMPDVPWEDFEFFIGLMKGRRV